MGECRYWVVPKCDSCAVDVVRLGLYNLFNEASFEVSVGIVVQMEQKKTKNQQKHIIPKKHERCMYVVRYDEE